MLPQTFERQRRQCRAASACDATFDYVAGNIVGDHLTHSVIQRARPRMVQHRVGLHRGINVGEFIVHYEVAHFARYSREILRAQTHHSSPQRIDRVGDRIGGHFAACLHQVGWIQDSCGWRSIVKTRRAAGAESLILKTEVHMPRSRLTAKSIARFCAVNPIAAPAATPTPP